MIDKIRYLEVVGGCVDENNTLWFCPFKFNSLFSYDLDKGVLMWKGVIPHEKKWQQSLYRNCIIIGDEIYMIPYNAKNIAVYNMTRETFEKIAIEDFGKESERYYCATFYERKIYVFGNRVPCISIVDCDTKEIVYFEKLHQELKAIKQTKDDMYFGHSIANYGHICYLNALGTNAVVSFDTEKCDYSIIELGDARGMYVNLVKRENLLYLIPGMHKKVAVWDIKNSTLTELGDELLEPFQYNGAFIYNNYLYELPVYANQVLMTSLRGDEVLVKELDEYYNEFFCGDSVNGFKETKFSYVYEDDNWIVYFCRMNREIYTIKKLTGELQHKCLVMDVDSRMKIAKYFCEPLLLGERIELTKENVMFDLGAFVYHLEEGLLS